jgi:inosine-uridine nucleoside N-ribohydrolase
MNLRKMYDPHCVNSSIAAKEAGDFQPLFLAHRLRSFFWRLPVITLSLFLAYGCTQNSSSKVADPEKESPAVRVIFETDMGNDIDDALALDMLYKYADQGKVELLAVNSNKDNDYSVRYIDILNTWYGYPEIPIGKVVNGVDADNDAKNYAQSTWEYGVDGKQAFKGSLPDYSKVPDATTLYRQVLARQPDSSVTIISVGFSTNIARLLHTGADEFSDLSGKELVARKVKLLSVMAGNFAGKPFAEYNVEKDIKAASTVFAEWPTQIVASPWEVGNSIVYPATSIQNDFNWVAHHPAVVAYESYLPMPYDRPTWDLTSVLYVAEGPDGYFTLSKKGTITVDATGITSFKEDPAGRHQYLKVTPQQAARVKERFIELVSAKPKILQQKPGEG